MLGESMVFFASQVLPIRSAFYATKIAIFQHDELDSTRGEPFLNLVNVPGSFGGDSITSVVAARLQDNHSCSVRRRAVEPREHAVGRVAVDSALTTVTRRPFARNMSSSCAG